MAKDGKETWLTDLKPAQAKVGYMELFVNRNYAGKALKIGSREFERGFWAHAPSVLVFDLAGKYEWFETWFGLDALAAQSGSSAFVIGDSVESASAPELDAGLRALLSRDFPGRQPRQEMECEFADGIWDGMVFRGAEPTPSASAMRRPSFARWSCRANQPTACPASGTPKPSRLCATCITK